MVIHLNNRNSGFTDHGLLSGLADDDHTQYLKLLGRAGGQIAYGGTAASENLTLHSTSNITKGIITLHDNTLIPHHLGLGNNGSISADWVENLSASFTTDGAEMGGVDNQIIYSKGTATTLYAYKGSMIINNDYGVPSVDNAYGFYFQGMNSSSDNMIYLKGLQGQVFQNNAGSTTSYAIGLEGSCAAVLGIITDGTGIKGTVTDATTATAILGQVFASATPTVTLTTAIGGRFIAIDSHYAQNYGLYATASSGSVTSRAGWFTGSYVHVGDSGTATNTGDGWLFAEAGIEVDAFSTAGFVKNDSAGVFSGGNMVTGADITAPLTLTVNDAVTNAVTDVLTITHSTTGAAANGIGTGMVWKSEDGSGNIEEIGCIDFVNYDATHATQKSRLNISVLGLQQMTLDEKGFIGLGPVTAPTYDLSMAGNAAHIIWNERNTGTSPGQNLTIQAGGAPNGATDIAGGVAILSGGISTGTGGSQAAIYTAPSVPTGSGDVNPRQVCLFTSAGAMILLNKITTYNNIATQGYGVPAIVSRVGLVNQVGSISTTNLVNANAAGDYRVGVYLECTTLDAGAGTVLCTIAYTDDVGATTTATAALAETATGRTSLTYFPIRLASGNITYATTVAGTPGNARYALYITCERLN